MILSTLLLPQPALGCGGFLCSNAQPIVQNAERIVFDLGDGEVQAHVQIFYEGPSTEFAWIVPVATEPELFASPQALFNVLPIATGPVFQLNQVIEGNCRTRGIESAAQAPVFSNGSSTDVTVVSEGQVGPFDTLVLQASSDVALLDYLQANGYDLPDTLDAALAPYIAEEAYFVALKLQSDRNSGDITPLGMRYAGDSASVPIQLTSLAAAPDTRLEVYVFAEERAVPTSYLHVQINDAAIDWWTGGLNYPEVITVAADEAGGHAFATDFAGDPAFLQNVVYKGSWGEGGLLDQTTPEDWVDHLRRVLPGSPEMENIIDEVLQSTDPFDPVRWTAVVQERIVRPLEDIEEMFRSAYLTRLTSSLDADEMTVDPIFETNPDMSVPAFDVAQVRSADLVFECRRGKTMDKVDRRLELADGRVIALPSQAWFTDQRITEIEYLSDLGATKAQVIEQTGTSGVPEVLFDATQELAALVDAHNGRLLGCRCSSTGGTLPGSLALFGLLGLGARRRRQR